MSKFIFNIGKLYNQDFFQENRFCCYVDVRDYINDAADIEHDTKILNEPDDFDLDQLNTDVQQVENVLNEKMQGIMPLSISMFSNDSIFEWTDAEIDVMAWPIGEKIHSFIQGTRLKINALSESSQEEYKRLIKSELIITDVIEKLDAKKENLIKRKQALLKAIEANNKLRSRFNPARYVHLGESFEKWKLENKDIKGEDKKKHILEKKKKEIVKNKQKYEKAMEKKLMPYRNVRDNIVNFFEAGGIEKKSAELFVKGIAEWKVEINWSSDIAIVGKESPYDTLIPDTFWEQLGETEKDLIRKTVERFMDKDQGNLHAFETQKHNVERFKEYKKQHLEYATIEEWKTIKIPKIQIDGKTLQSGKYLAVKKIGNQMVYLRTDDRENNKNDFTKDVIVYNANTREWKFAEDKILKDGDVAQKIFIKKYKPSSKKIYAEIQLLETQINWWKIPKAVLLNRVNKIEKLLKKHYSLKWRVRLREIWFDGKNLKNYFNQQKTTINSLGI